MRRLPIRHPSRIAITPDRLRLPHLFRRLLLIGLFLVSLSIPRSTLAEEPEQLRFVSYNLESYLDSVEEDEVKLRAITRFLVELRPDVLGVCEIGDLSKVEHLQERLAAAGVDLPHVEWVDGPSTRCLALLSRFPIVERQSVPLVHYQINELTLPVSRGFLDITIQVNEDYRLRCLGAHLKSRRSVPEADEALIRRNEAHLLRLHAEAILEKSPHVNLLVYGDFNDTRNSSSIRAIQGRTGANGYLRALPLSDDQGYTWTHYWDNADVYSRIDFLFASPGLNRELDLSKSLIGHHRDWELASDHRPLLVTIQAENR